MEYRKFGDRLVVRMDPGEEILAGLLEICKAEGIGLAEVKALGALNEFTVGLFDLERKTYISNDFHEMVEITSLWGTVSTKDGKFYPHLHMSAGNRTGQVYGGHLNRAVVSATCEMVITVLDGKVEREFSPEIGLNLFKFL